MALVRSWLTRWGNVVRRPASHRPRRSFHSEERDAPPGSFGTVERTILSASLRHVPAHGFSEAALVRGAQDVGYPDVSINLFPRGVFDLVLHHLVEEREALANRSAVVSEPAAECDAVYSGAEAAASPVRRRVARLTLNRLMSNQPIIHRWHEALSIMSHPTYLTASLAELARLSDQIWFAAGDTSLDSTWYTKRASLAATYASAELYMTQDRSLDFVDTERFLHRRLAELDYLGTRMAHAGSWLDFTRHAFVNLLRSQGAPI